MNDKYVIGNSVLWAAAILASAIYHAPATLTVVILPALFVGSLVMYPKTRDAGCSR